MRYISIIATIFITGIVEPVYGLYQWGKKARGITANIKKTFSPLTLRRQFTLIYFFP